MLASALACGRGGKGAVGFLERADAAFQLGGDATETAITSVRIGQRVEVVDEAFRDHLLRISFRETLRHQILCEIVGDTRFDLIDPRGPVRRHRNQ